MRLLPALLLLPLAGCTGADPGMGLRSSAALLPQTAAASAPVGVFLPLPTGAALASTEREGPQFRLRRTALRSDGTVPGENFVSVETGGSGGTRPGLLRPPSVETIRAEMRAALPGVPMRFGATMEENGSGPFGYALGHAGGTACLYAWQWLDLGRRGGFLARRDPAGIRVRLCRGTETEPLLEAVRAMRVGDGAGNSLLGGDIAGFGGGDALAATGTATTAGLSADADRFDQENGSDQSAGFETVDEPPPPAPHRMTRRTASAPVRTAAPQPPSMPDGDAPAIPLPGSLPAVAASVPDGAVTPGPLAPRQPAPMPDDDAPLIPDPGTTAATR